jgi:rfaE bifunctional protein kinase chain/domain
MITRLAELLDRFPTRTVTVVGDIMADEFIYGRIARVSREAPVLILEYDSTQIVAGGAGNAANNVASLGGRVRLIGATGRDEAGRRAIASLHRRVERDGLLRSRDLRTPTKTRILAGGIHSAKQQVVRIDRDVGRPLERAAGEQFARSVDAAVASCDAVILSDYGSGLVTPALAGRIKAAIAGGPPTPILVDSRYGLLGYRGLTTCTPNESEVEQLLGVTIDDDSKVLERAGRSLLTRTRMTSVLITRGSRGMALFEPRRPTVHLPIHGSDQIADVTGAGDTVIAAMSMALACGASAAEAARLANVAGGLVVMKRGTASVTLGELRAAVEAR